MDEAMSALGRDLAARRGRTDRLMSVEPGTPMGEYLRRFWYPVALTSELEAWPVKNVRLLSELLALFRGDEGTLGLVADRCPHRGVSLSCGMTDGELLRCAYHNWAFDASGACVDTPAEPATSRLKERAGIAGYPVQELGGLVWAYIGPAPAPLLPRYEHLVRADVNRTIGFTDLPCNWLRIAENNLDPKHVEYLHMRYMNWVRQRRGEQPIPTRRHAKIDFELFEYGILKKRLWEGDSEESDEWRTGHPLFFPGNNLVAMTARHVELQFRVPMDNDRTAVYWYQAKECEPGENASAISIVENPWNTSEGKYRPESIQGQDMMMFVSMGNVDLRNEHLGESDRGVALYRRTLLDECERVQRGEDPRGVIRDPAKNEPFIRLPHERSFGFALSNVQNNATQINPAREAIVPEDLAKSRDGRGALK
jgi:5,5'-dehydrodivanillate O-demethylase oxygenase subunit